MARQHGPLQLTGSLGNLSFYYHKEYGYLARQKGGARPGKASPRTKENGDELGTASRTGKLIRQGIRAALLMEGDSTLSQRLTGCLYRVLQQDRTSVRGERQVAKGLETMEGKQLLSSFAFVKEVPLERVLLMVPLLSQESRGVLLKDFLPERDLSWPKGATHVQLQAGVVFVDIAGDAYRAFGTEVTVLSVDSGEGDIELGFEKLPRGEGFRLFVVSVVFLTTVNGELTGMAESRSLKIVVDVEQAG